jgi:hypothetical protein
MTGADPADEFRGRYGARDASRVDLAALGDELFGEAVPVVLAQRGDVALTRMEGRLAAGIVIGAYVAVPGEAGLIALPLASAARAWRV